MALYEEVFQSKGAVFTIRNAGPQDAQAMLDYMGCVDRETTFWPGSPGSSSGASLWRRSGPIWQAARRAPASCSCWL